MGGVALGAAVALLAVHLRARAAAAGLDGRLREAFAAMATEALSSNSEQFLRLARESLSVQTTAGAAELEQRRQLIDRSIQQVTERLEAVRVVAGKLEAARKEDYGQLGQRLSEALQQVGQLRQTTEDLRAALAHPQRRGQWGESMADDILQMAGMIPGVNYTKQQTMAETGRRPDFTFMLPNGMKLNMDVKFPLDNYLKCIAAPGTDERARAAQCFLTDVRVQLRAIATREYINPAGGTAAFALMFIPNEQVFSFIQELDTALLSEAARRNVLLVGPLSLLAVLAITRQAAESANLSRQASEALTLLADFSKQWGLFKHQMDTLGERLERATKEFQTLVTTRTNTLERPLGRLEQLRIGNGQESETAGEVTTDGREAQ